MNTQSSGSAAQSSSCLLQDTLVYEMVMLARHECSKCRQPDGEFDKESPDRNMSTAFGEIDIQTAVNYCLWTMSVRGDTTHLLELVAMACDCNYVMEQLNICYS